MPGFAAMTWYGFTRRIRPGPPLRTAESFAATIRNAIMALLTGAWLLLPTGASAQLCSITNGTIAFGTYTGALSTAGTTTISVTCSMGFAYSIQMNAGSHSGAAGTGAYNWELMGSASGSYLHYSIYRDAARTASWGGTPGTDSVNGTGTGSPQTYTVYPQIPANSAVIPGTYTDTITTNVQSLATIVYGTISVTATVPTSCTVSVSPLTFGTYTGTQTDALATVSALCSNTTPYYVGLDLGLHNGGSAYDWEMSGPGSVHLAYKLYQDSARTQYWGATSNFDTPSGTGTGSQQPITLYGRIPAGQYVRPGSYTDTVTLLIHY